MEVIDSMLQQDRAADDESKSCSLFAVGFFFFFPSGLSCHTELTSTLILRRLAVTSAVESQLLLGTSERNVFL